MQGAQIWALFRELRSYVVQSEKQEYTFQFEQLKPAKLKVRDATNMPLISHMYSRVQSRKKNTKNIPR